MRGYVTSGRLRHQCEGTSSCSRMLYITSGTISGPWYFPQVHHVVSHVSPCYIIGCPPPPACQQISENLPPPLQNPGSAYVSGCL